MALLLREAIGERLRRTRTAQRRTLREVSRAARVSLGYLSEVERGRKEPSSELLAAICTALELPLSELLNNVALDIRRDEPVVPALPTAAGVGEGREAPAAREGETEVGKLVPAVVGTDLADLRLQPMLSHRLPATIGPSSLGGGKQLNATCKQVIVAA
ncbi:Transcriptional regulator, contains XRE-family HTH domain [Streptoalloteichus tenebrarius]|uniref:Transcriptional regulator, contains XRE-family HTH domain n=1 Tax=Streptoalloteichus tenebrarius (strain ATCC 17920 / DSM 40477 / JCM 4838 / CBS 697.72 / NBRC 16177 / NCIMB 11028 / NRRL B-12390 / A12253. 1 / ISP 5477) TaxID=1933 RepID=A0ABT1HN41_STRSD|nr:helix-turn-helix transcriptional regulator [Streptoalloteichus tenebrarius]MCP2256941.1 Transcriptional regulator, contains XRE-family HTH domain [Streptoalloteichus tenebrarius]BFF00147.1 helix-turn-helix transcriptional regulator [Streptoalloteichus tenebrarius]